MVSVAKQLGGPFDTAGPNQASRVQKLFKLGLKIPGRNHAK